MLLVTLPGIESAVQRLQPAASFQVCMTEIGTYCIALIISRVFNFANLKLFAKFIELNFEPLHGQHASVKYFQQIPSKQLFTNI